MKRTILLCMLVAVTVGLCGCGDSRQINGTTYDTYGLFNEDTDKDPAVKYHIITGNVIWSVILCETIVFPIYFIGFSLYEPIGPTALVAPVAVK